MMWFIFQQHLNWDGWGVFFANGTPHDQNQCAELIEIPGREVV